MTDVTHTDEGGSEPVFRLLYRSHSRIEPAERTAQLGAIFTSARRHNRELDITGALMITDDAFVQVLEGEEAPVRELYDRISDDPRHDQVSLLEDGVVESRTFGRWAMAKVATDGGPDIRLLSNAARGEIVAAPKDPSINPQQEKLLEVMRDALVLQTPGA
jgi:hypothetical protein